MNDLFQEHHSINAGLTSAPQDRIERYGHAIIGNCHIKLKEVQFNGRKIMGKGIMDTAGSFRLF